MRSPGLQAPLSDTDWTGLTTSPIPVAEACAWAVRPGCGAVVTFAGTVRDHAEGRPGVSLLDYEAYEGEVEPRLDALAASARQRWPMLGRLVLLHRTGALRVEEVAVLVVASAPHRGEAFEAARWCIDTLKATVPIWKRETWRDGADWGTCATAVSDHQRGR
ncbi:MAG TPA: molybdenum cofactor biosynthesis protein MoaE [Acidimicrobiales bacterium]|nr:molybdenum cofactor biosynthesis protein MoaE [Acidimicrobiales bacterium]